MTEPSHVVVAVAAADEEDALVPERRERAAHREVRLGIEAVQQRDLEHRDVRLGDGELERDERPVIEPAPRVLGGQEPGALEQRAGLRDEVRGAGRGPLELVGLGCEARVVVEHRRLCARHHGDDRLLPVRGDHEQRARPVGERAHETAQVRLERRPLLLGPEV